MKSDTTLLSRLEQLPALRAKAETQTGRVLAGTQKRIQNIKELEPVLQDIITCLEMQREQVGYNHSLRPVRQLTDHTRQEYLAGMPATVYYYMQRAFALPIDYHELTGTSQEKPSELLSLVIIQPELLSDDLLVGLGLMSENSLHQSPLKKIQTRVQSVPAVKQIFARAQPLQVGNKRTTGRILMIDMPENSFIHGKYIVFQESTRKGSGESKKHRYPLRNVTVRVYDDVFSLIRGQQKALAHLHEKRKKLRTLHNHSIPTILLQWKEPNYTQEAKDQDIQSIKDVLRGSMTFHEERALHDRLERIQHLHPEQDVRRIQGAWNDIQKEIGEKLGKEQEIEKQTEWLRENERHIREGFFDFIEILGNYLRNMPQSALMEKVRTMMRNRDELEPVGSGINDSLGRLQNILRNYLDQFSHRKGSSLGNPYTLIESILKEHFDSLPRKVNKEYLGVTLRSILNLKRFAHELFLMQYQHEQKLETSTNDEQQEKQRKRVTIFLESTFLGGIQLRECEKEFKNGEYDLKKLLDT